jgi:hypothetical protein
VAVVALVALVPLVDVAPGLDGSGEGEAGPPLDRPGVAVPGALPDAASGPSCEGLLGVWPEVQPASVAAAMAVTMISRRCRCWNVGLLLRR